MIDALRPSVPATALSKKDAGNRVVRRYALPTDLPHEVFPQFEGDFNPADLSTIPIPATITSMFAGCGGLDLGFEGNFKYKGETLGKLYFDVIAAYDKDETCIETYNKNFLVKEGKSPKAKALDLSRLANIPLMPKADILIGGFPCQDFSSCGPRKGLSTARGRLYRAMIEYMTLKKPAIVVGENVPNLSKIQDGKALNTILEDIRDAGYAATIWFLHAIDYGIPQDRIRVFIVAVRKDYAEVFGLPTAPAATHLDNFRTIEWAIGDLVSITDEAVANQSQYFKASRAKNGNGQGDETT